ncbi:MAG: hemerythrin domain-containing protein [Micrococcales bacterium]|nr:hemerythrin domain-containing protein [Micrococcales bacterium]
MCSYCGCESVTVIGRFMAEHEEVVNACGELRRSCGRRPTDVTRAADHLRALLRPHTDAEEMGLFAVLGQDPEFTEHVRTLCAEHAALDAALDRIAAGAHEEMSAFERALRRHIDREENGLFPAAAIRFAGPEWDLVVSMTPPASVP